MFYLKTYKQKKFFFIVSENFMTPLESGYVLVMHSGMQETHTHGLGKQESEEARYNLTFRWRKEKDEENQREKTQAVKKK